MATDKPLISILPDRDALMEAAAQRIIDIGRQAIAQRGQFAWALSGGSTPRALYELLGSERFSNTLDWPRVQFFWSDERCVPPDHPDSNYGMARAALLGRLPLTAAQVHRMPGEAPPEAAARAYELQLRAAGRLDLVLLGMGTDGHTASLFPHSAALSESERWVVPNLSPTGSQRLTFTFATINHAAVALFLVAGADKAERVKQALQEPNADLPVQRVRGHVEWMLDKQAAGGLA